MRSGGRLAMLRALRLFACVAMRRKWAALLLAAPMATSVGCQAVSEPLRARYPDLPAEAQSVPFAVVEALVAPMSALEEARSTVLRTPREWDEYWTAFHAHVDPAPPATPFEGDVLVVALGMRFSGGYSVEIEGVFDTPTARYVAALEIMPGDDCMVTQALTAPATAVRVPPSPLPVTFLHRTEARPCG